MQIIHHICSINSYDMKGKIIAIIIATVTLLGPFQLAFIYNDNNSNMFNVIMFLLSVAGLVGAFVVATESRGAVKKH